MWREEKVIKPVYGNHCQKGKKLNHFKTPWSLFWQENQGGLFAFSFTPIQSKHLF